MEKFTTPFLRRSAGVAALSLSLLIGGSAAHAQTMTMTPATPGSTTIQVMTHLCNSSVHNIQDFQALEQGLSPIAALANTVLNCPATGLTNSMAVANTVASPRTSYDFQVMGNGTTQTLGANGSFMPHKICESDINVDVNHDGMISSTTCLDISHYEIPNVMSTSGSVINVTENAPPAGFHFGALRFTPPALINNNDAGSLRGIDPVTGSVQLDTANDTDHVVMMHVYDFVNTSTPNPSQGGSMMGNTSLIISLQQQIIALLQQELLLFGVK